MSRPDERLDPVGEFGFVPRQRPSLATVLTAAELAPLMGYEGSNATRRAKQRLRRLGVAKQDTPNGHTYTTLGQLMEAEPDLAMEVVSRRSAPKRPKAAT